MRTSPKGVTPVTAVTPLSSPAGTEQGPIPNVPATLTSLASRVRRLVPSHSNPERFHEEKSEIAHALRILAREVSHG